MPNATARPSKNRVLENFISTLHDLTGLNISFVDLGGFTKLKKFNIDEAAYSERCVVGSVDAVVARLHEYERAGCDRVMLQHLLHTDLEPVRLIGRELAPALA